MFQAEPTTTPRARGRVPQDLAQVATALKGHFGPRLPRGYVQGKTAMRDAIMERYSASAMEAETIVEQLQARGFVRYAGDPRGVSTGREPWVINAQPLCVS